MEMEVTGNASIDVEIWVHPSGKTLRRDVSTIRWGQQKVEQPPKVPPEEPPIEVSGCLQKFSEIRPLLWSAITDYEANIDRLESTPAGADRAPIEADIQKSVEAIRARVADWHKLRDQAEAEGDDDCVNEIQDEENQVSEQLDADLERYNQIK